MGALAQEHTIASYAVDLVTALGSDTAFALTGGMAMFLNRAISVHPGLRTVYCQHEQACVAAAEGYAKAADFQVAGFAVVTSGPGVSNTITSLLSAYGDSTPLIVLAGQIKTDDIDRLGTRTHGAQEIRSRAIVSPCVKRFTRLSATDFREALADTLVEAFIGRPGPVFIEIPLEVQGARVSDTADDTDAAAAAIRARIAAATADLSAPRALTAALEELLRSPRPLLYVGNGCRVAGMAGAVRAFLIEHQLPSVFSWLSFDILPGSHDLHFGCPGGLAPISANAILFAAETILFLGARLDLGTTAFQRADFGAQARRIFVDVDPAELAKFADYDNTRCIGADLRGLPAVLAAIAQPGAADAGWLGWCRARRAAYLADERARLESGNLTIYGVAAALSAASDTRTFALASSGYAQETFTRFFRAGQDTRLFNGAALGAMGLGLPSAIGAAFGASRPVFCIEADGGIMLNIQELATLAHYAPKGFVLCILNNNGYESIRLSQSRHYQSVSGVDRDTGVAIPDFAALAAAFGLPYIRVEGLGALDDAIRTLDPQAPPVVVDLIIARFEPRGPSVRTIIDADGRPSSTRLSALSW